MQAGQHSPSVRTMRWPFSTRKLESGKFVPPRQTSSKRRVISSATSSPPSRPGGPGSSRGRSDDAQPPRSGRRLRPRTRRFRHADPISAIRYERIAGVVQSIIAFADARAVPWTFQFGTGMISPVLYRLSIHELPGRSG